MTYDGAAIRRDGKRLRLGWTFGQCLATAWTAAKVRRRAPREQNRVNGRERAARSNVSMLPKRIKVVRKTGRNPEADGQLASE